MTFESLPMFLGLKVDETCKKISNECREQLEKSLKEIEYALLQHASEEIDKELAKRPSKPYYRKGRWD